MRAVHARQLSNNLRQEHPEEMQEDRQAVGPHQELVVMGDQAVVEEQAVTEGAHLEELDKTKHPTLSRICSASSMHPPHRGDTELDSRVLDRSRAGPRSCTRGA